MANVGPVCHIPPTNNVGNPQPTNLPGIPPPAAPNVQSLTSTVNQLLQILKTLLGQTGRPGASGAPGAKGQAAPAGSWTQSNIVTEKVKIYQNNDPSTGVYVEVERINSLTMSNKTTNQTWVFNRPPDPQQGG